MSSNPPPPTPPPPAAPSPPSPEELEFRKKVDQVLLYWIKKLGGWVGAGSVIAFLAVLWAFYVAVVDGAKQEAARIAHDSVDPMTKTVSAALSKSLTDYLDAYNKLEEQKKNLETSVNQSLTTIQTLEGKIQGLNDTVGKDSSNLTVVLAGIDKASSDLTALQANLKSVQDLDTSKLAEVFTELTKEDPDLLPKLDKLFSELQNCYTYNLSIVDSNPAHEFSRNLFLLGKPLGNIPNIDAKAAEILKDYLTAGSNDITAGSAYSTLGSVFDKIARTFNITLPPNAQIVATWDVPYDGLISRKYSCSQEASTITVKFNPKEKDEGDVTLYILYRTPIHVADKQ